MANHNLFYCNHDQSWLVVISTHEASNSKHVCNLRIQEIPDDTKAECSLSLYEPHVADQLILDGYIAEGLLKETSEHVARSIIKKFENRNQELLTFCEL